MKHQKIAVIGAGVSGLAAAAFLQKSGHSVTLYEKFEAAKPVGAGLLLQPTGLSVLALLGLDRRIVDEGSIIHQLYGKVGGSNWVTLNVRYQDLAPHLFGVGVYRGNLFAALYEKAVQLGVKVIVNNDINNIVYQQGKAEIANSRGEAQGAYDLVVDASGAKSALRRKYAQVKLDKPYPYGAAWAIVKIRDSSFHTDRLEQRYRLAQQMMGVLPVGRLGGEDCMSAALFWSMRVADYPQWKAQDFSAWQEQATRLWPETASLTAQFKDSDDLAFAKYSDVILSEYYQNNIVFIGDAAHCTSPQLGQGANLALVDALFLSQCMDRSETVMEALAEYSRSRRNHLRYYQQASRMLTPFFQSDSVFFAKLRTLACGMACKIPYTRRYAAHVLTGTKTGIFSTMNPGEWSADYDLFSTSSKAVMD